MSALQAYLPLRSCRRSALGAECSLEFPLPIGGGGEQTASALPFSPTAAESAQNADVKAVSFTSY